MRVARAAPREGCYTGGSMYHGARSETARGALLALVLLALVTIATGCAGSPADPGEGPVSDAGGGDPAADAAAPDAAPTAGGGSDACGVARTGPVLHVAPGGDDRSDCSAASPCLTIQRAADLAAAPGSVVRVASGTYSGFTTPHPDVTFEAVGDVIIDEPAGGAQDNVVVSGTDDVVISGFRVRGAPRAGVAVLDAADVTVCGNASGPNGRWGIFTQYAPRVVIANNEAFGSAREHGIYVSNSRGTGDVPRVIHNQVHDNHGNGIQLNGDCQWPGDGTLDSAVIEGNVVTGNGTKGLSIIAAPGALIANNIIDANGPAAGGIHMTNEPGCPAELASSGGVVVNNTVVETTMPPFRATDGATGNVVFNNLFVGPGGAADEVGGNHLDHNLTVDRGTGLFGPDFTLAPGSAARDGGVAEFLDHPAPAADIDGVPRPQGGAPDLGAREAPASSPAP